MKRRMFLTSGSAILIGGSSSVFNMTKPAVGLDFSLLNVSEARPNNTESVLVSFEKLELMPAYVDEDSKFSITIKLDVNGVKADRSTEVYLENGSTSDLSTDSSLNPVKVEGIGEPDEEFIQGKITIDISHPDISKNYSRRFTIKKDTVVPEGLVAHWTMSDIGSDDKLIDATDNNNNASKVGTPNYSVVNGPVYDDAVYYYANSTGEDGWDAGDSIVWNNLDSVTLSLWYKSDTDQQSMIAGNGGGWDSTGFMIFQLNSSDIRWEQQDGSKVNIDWSGFPKNEWVHVVGVWDGSEMRIYGNNDEKSSSNYTGTHSGDHNFGLGLNVLDKVGDGPDYDMRGSLQDVRIYNRALEDSEIQKLYQLGQ